MARIRGGKTTVIYDTTKRQPLDSRMLVNKRADLINPAIWTTTASETEAMFNGMIVAVNNDTVFNGVYYLLNRLLVTAENYTSYKEAAASGADIEPFFSMWIKLASLEDLESLKDQINSFSSIVVDGGEITT